MSALTRASESQLNPIEPYAVQQALVALTLSAGDEPLLRYLNFFSREIPIGRAYFLHVVPRPESLPASPGRYQIKKGVVNKLEEQVNNTLQEGQIVHLSFDIREGAPLEELLKDARDLHADLTIIGQRSDRQVHGILAKNLARKVQGHALVVPADSPIRLEHILVPLDFSASSLAALRQALAIRLQLGSQVKVTCLHIFEAPNLRFYQVEESAEELEEVLRKDREEAFEAFMHTYFKDQRNEVKAVTIPQEEGSIAEQILTYAQQQGGDLIVMGAKGHSSVELLLMGSVTEKLLSLNERIPTLISKSEPTE